MPPFWDFNEFNNYTVLNVKNRQYGVLNLPKSDKAANLLNRSDTFIDNKLEKLQQNLHKYPQHTRDGLHLLLTTPFYLQEMQLDTNEFPVQFEGLNKPKNVVGHRDNVIIGSDKKLRASYRVVFLKLRVGNRIKTFNELKPLIIHEIAHTACNHVTWRDDDHGDDFKMYEKIIEGL